MGITETIQTSIEGAVATITLDRPEVHHAMNIEMIREVATALAGMRQNESIRIIRLRATGDHFSAGADLDWMREGMKQSEAQLKQESMELAGLFRLLSEMPQVVVSAVQGKVLGGANGLIAASDLVIAEDTARFSFSEVKLGLVPATVAPFVVRKAGIGRAAAWMLTGLVFSAEDARTAGLVHFICEEGKLAEETGHLTDELLSNGPEAMQGIKQMLRHMESGRDPQKIQEETAAIIARYRISPEGQEGMNAFFEKRKPGWHGNP